MNTNNEKDFVPYEQALALKELGFDEPCLAKYCKYNLTDKIKLFPQSQDFFKGYFNQCTNSEYKKEDKVAAPLYQQAFSFFREKYNLREQYGVFPHHTIMINYLIEGGREEEAELECLNKLIEIVKQQTHATTN